MTENVKNAIHIAGSKYAVIAIAVFAIAQLSRNVLYSFEGYAGAVHALPRALDFAEQPLRWTLIVLVGLYAAHRIGPWRAIEELGLRSNIGYAALFCGVTTLPMAIVPLFIGSLNRDIDPLWVLFSACFWPLGEEILFRGYLFRQLYRRAHWGFWSAALASSVIFGTVHLTSAAIQRQPIVEQFGAIVMITVLSVLGAWVFIRWDDNLWIMVGLHGFMNLWWAVFDLGETALGSGLGNVTRLGVVVLAIVITLYRKPIEKRLSQLLRPQLA